jgi:hypothetical protein
VSSHPAVQEPELQVFLPYASFAHSVRCLDRARLGKQRVECQQILSTLYKRAAGEPAAGWANHPAVRMWAGHPAALGVYMTMCVRAWESRGYANTLITPYDEAWAPNPAYYWADAMVPVRDVEVPLWLGDEAFHASHRSALLRKMPDFYSPLGWTDNPEDPYVWPVR